MSFMYSAIFSPWRAEIASAKHDFLCFNYCIKDDRVFSYLRPSEGFRYGEAGPQLHGQWGTQYRPDRSWREIALHQFAWTTVVQQDYQLAWSREIDIRSWPALSFDLLDELLIGTFQVANPAIRVGASYVSSFSYKGWSSFSSIGFNLPRNSAYDASLACYNEFRLPY